MQKGQTKEIPNLRFVIGHPQGGELVRAYMANNEAVRDFYGPHFRDLSAFSLKAEEVDGTFDRAARERAAEALIVPPGGDRSRLDRFVDEGGYMVTTGQQAALFGGPLFSLYKALTAVRLAEVLEDKLERPVIPVFWVGSEDHDWEEASQVGVVGVDNEIHHLQVANPNPSRTPPLHKVQLNDDVSEVVAEFLGHLPDTDFSDEYKALLGDAFIPGKTLVDGFHKTLQYLTGRFGLFFTDAAHPVVKRDSAEVLLAELDRAEEFEGVLQNTADALTTAGYPLQVSILKDSVNLFLEGPAGRERLYRQNSKYRLRRSGDEVSREDIQKCVDADPLALSPNVLLRPVVEATLFPTLAYVGGPGELAYFGQLRDYFAAHGTSMPVLYPRHAAMPVEAKIGKVLDKFGLDVDALAQPFHEVVGDVARHEIPDKVKSALSELRTTIGSRMGELTIAVKEVDPTLSGPVKQVRTDVFSAFDELERKVLQAVKRGSEIHLSQVEKAQVHLYPGGKPSERVQSPFYFLTRYGGPVLDVLYDSFKVNLE